MGKDGSKEGFAEKGDKKSSDMGTTLISKVADSDQKALISQNADGAPAKTGPAKGALQNVAKAAGGQLPKKAGPGQQQRKKKQPGGKPGSRAANAGSSASAQVSAEAGQPGKRVGQDVGSAKSMNAGPGGGVQKVGRPQKSTQLTYLKLQVSFLSRGSITLRSRA